MIPFQSLQQSKQKSVHSCIPTKSNQSLLLFQTGNSNEKASTAVCWHEQNQSHAIALLQYADSPARIPHRPTSFPCLENQFGKSACMKSRMPAGLKSCSLLCASIMDRYYHIQNRSINKRVSGFISVLCNRINLYEPGRK